jgi:hypothetical protein
VLWVSGQQVGSSLSWKPLQREGKTCIALDLSNELPQPTCTLLPDSTSFMGVEKTWGLGDRKRKSLCNGKGERKQQSQLSHPSSNPHYKQIHFSTLENNNPFIQPVSNLIIDFRPWVESKEDVGRWKMGWGLEEGKCGANKKKMGVGGMA